MCVTLQYRTAPPVFMNISEYKFEDNVFLFIKQLVHLSIQLLK